MCDAAGLSSALALTPQPLLWRVFFKTKVWLIRMVLCHAGSAPVMRMKKSTDRVFSKSVYAGNRQSAVCMGPAHQQVSFESLAGYLWCRNIHVRAIAESFGVIYFFNYEDKLYFLEQFQVHSKIENKVFIQRIPIYFPPHTSIVKSFNHVWLFAIPWTAAYQAPLSMDFPGKSTGVGCHCLLLRVGKTSFL